MSDLANAKERVATWIKLIQDANADKRTRDFQADRQSLDRAVDLEEIFEEMAWVGEIPEPKRKRLGRRTDPKGRDQFAKWVRQTYEWNVKPDRLRQLKAATDIAPILVTAVPGIQPTGEWSLRPLGKLRDQGYGDHQAEVWREAVSLAGNVSPTESQVRKAVTEFLDRHKPPVRNVATDPRTIAEIRAARRARLIAQFDELLAEENVMAKKALDEMIRHFNQHQSQLREEVAA